MPIYEYACDKCGVFETTQRITEQPLKKCPTCKGKVKKLISNTSFQLKGSGWYVTDYGGKKGGDGEAKSAKDSGKDGAKESGSTGDSAASSSESATGGTASESKTKEKSKSKKDAAAKAA